MTSLKRVRTALEHGEPDKLLIDFGGMRSTGIQTIAYNRLLDHLGIRDEKAKVYDVFQQLAEPSPEVVGRLNGDACQIHRLKPAFGIDILGWRDGGYDFTQAHSIQADVSPDEVMAIYEIAVEYR